MVSTLILTKLHFRKLEKILVAMVSSTARDLPEYRKQVMDAWSRSRVFAKMMEHLPAQDADAVKVSLEMVDKSDIYIGIFAHRYGYVPKRYDISVTQMEYERAVEKGIPRLIFLMSDKVWVLPEDFDLEYHKPLKALKKKLSTELVVNFFDGPEDLRGKVIQALEKVKKELEMLTDWVAGKKGLQNISIFNIVAIGRMGKSALTWAWFKEIAPQEKHWDGRIWWSFYESDATFKNFVTRTLIYTSGQSEDEIQEMSYRDRQDALLRILDQEEHLIALDGLGRILIAYALQDAAYLNDDEAIDEETANRVAGAYGLPESAGKSYIGKHKVRQAADPRIAIFLRKLAGISKSRILISTRLYPADIQIPTNQPFPGCYARFLNGLNDQDAMDMWRAYGARGSHDVMIPVFQTFDRHPLLLQVLANEVAEYREAPGDFEAWQRDNPDFKIFELPLIQVQSEILSQALKGLSDGEIKTLETIAAFRMPANMDTVKALLTYESESDTNKPFKQLHELDHALTSLEDRGLLGWDRKANRYDLHPIVRGVVW